MVRLIDSHIHEVVEKVARLWDLTEVAYVRIEGAFRENNRKKALKVSKEDALINELEEEVNEDAIRVITLQAPVASDLRLLISSLKIAGQLERIADYTVNIADYVLVADEKGFSATVVDEDVLKMINYVLEMLKLAKEAYLNEDIEAAKQIIEMDKQLDKIYGKSLRRIVKDIDGEDIHEANLQSALIVKYLERAGDHIVNVCEAIFYMVKGRHLRHSADTYNESEFDEI